MNGVDSALAKLAASQRQVFTRDQARAAGLSPAAIYRRVASGLLVPYGNHILHFGGVTLDFRARLMAGLLDLGRDALVSGPSAAALHGLDGFDEGSLHFLVPRSQRKRTTVGAVASSPHIGLRDRTTVDGLRVTSGTRTVLELIGRVSEHELGNAIDSGTRQGLTAPSVLRRDLLDLGRQGRAGVEMFDRVMESEGVQSWVERQFLRLVVGAGYRRPTLQRVYRHDGRHVARVDADFEPAPVIIEIGGRRGYMSAAERRRQEHRRNDVQLLRKVIYFFTSEDIVEDPRYVLTMLHAALAAHAA